MSSYVNFYLKDSKGNYSYLFGYSRSHMVYESFYHVMGYNKVNDYCGELTIEDCRYIREYLKDKQNSNMREIEDHKVALANIGSWNNTIKEKMEYMSDWQYSIKEYEEEIECCKFADNLYFILSDMLDFNPNHITIYAGIDCWASKEEEEANK